MSIILNYAMEQNKHDPASNKVVVIGFCSVGYDLRVSDKEKAFVTVIRMKNPVKEACDHAVSYCSNLDAYSY
jgi:hypothetical protein